MAPFAGGWSVKIIAKVNATLDGKVICLSKSSAWIYYGENRSCDRKYTEFIHAKFPSLIFVNDSQYGRFWQNRKEGLNAFSHARKFTVN